MEYLFLVNGVDDVPQDGFVDNLWNTSNNNGNALTDQTIEFENETWQGALTSLLSPVNALIGSLPVPNPVNNVPATLGILNQPYSIIRRPVPSAKGREIQLPSDVVIDLTTWGNPIQERSRLPGMGPIAQGLPAQGLPAEAFNQYSGSIDILVYPSGQVVPTMNYSTPASVGLNGPFLHFWLAERRDVVPPSPIAAAVPYLPIGNILQIPGVTPIPYPGPKLKGEYRLVTVFTRNGQIATNDNVPFDNPAAPQNGQNYNPSLPFLQAQEGITGGQ